MLSSLNISLADSFSSLCQQDIAKYCVDSKTSDQIHACLQKQKVKLSNTCAAFYLKRPKQLSQKKEALGKACGDQVKKLCDIAPGKGVRLTDCAATQPFTGECKRLLQELGFLK